MKVIYFDTETTGLLKPAGADLKKQPYIIDIGAIVAIDGQITDKYSQLVKPPFLIDDTITKITKITNDMLKDQPSFKDILPDLVKLFSDCDCLVAHNAKFDMGMLINELKRAEFLDQFPMPRRVMCTVEEFEPLFGYKPKLTEVWHKVFGTTLDEQHRALSDALDLAKICFKAGLDYE